MNPTVGESVPRCSYEQRDETRVTRRWGAPWVRSLLVGVDAGCRDRFACGVPDEDHPRSPTPVIKLEKSVYVARTGVRPRSRRRAARLAIATASRSPATGTGAWCRRCSTATSSYGRRTRGRAVSGAAQPKPGLWRSGRGRLPGERGVHLRDSRAHSLDLEAVGTTDVRAEAAMPNERAIRHRWPRPRRASIVLGRRSTDHDRALGSSR